MKDVLKMELKEIPMTKVDELIHILSKHDHAKSFTKAKSRRVCVICGQKAMVFKTTMAQFEYNNSAICQNCQMAIKTVGHHN